MQIIIGEKIREFRKKNKKTQEDLANALGVTCQAVSRWESNGGFPDMQLLPAIANYFGISIDKLFGYEGERENKINEMLSHVEKIKQENLDNDEKLNECLSILRSGLAEFPGNERIMYSLGCILDEMGWSTHSEWTRYSDDGYISYGFDIKKKNNYWKEAIGLFEMLSQNAESNNIKTDSKCRLVLLYRITGEKEKSVSMALELPSVSQSKEVMLTVATDGMEQNQYLGESILKLSFCLSEQIIYSLVNNIKNYDTDLPIDKIKDAISLFRIACEDQNYGIYNEQISYLYLYLARVQWEKGYKDQSFESLYNALHHACLYDAIEFDKYINYTSILVRHCRFKKNKKIKLSKSLPEIFPMWCNPDYRAVKEQMSKDDRWKAWVNETQK